MVLVCVVGCAPAPQAAEPVRSRTGIRLLVNGEGRAPAILDVDSGASAPVTGLPGPDPRLTVSASAHGRHTLISVSGPKVNQGRLYPVRPARQARPDVDPPCPRQPQKDRGLPGHRGRDR